MVRNVPSTTKLPFCVPSLCHVHHHFFRAVFKYMVIWGPNDHIDYLLFFFLYHFLNTKGALSSKMWALVSARRSMAAAKKQLPVASLTAWTPWEVVCRTREMQPLDLMAFHTLFVRTETTAQNTSRGRAGPGGSLCFICACCRRWPWLALMSLPHLI